MSNPEQPSEIPDLPLRDLLGIWRWDVKYPDYISPNYKNYRNGRAVRELDQMEAAINAHIVSVLEELKVSFNDGKQSHSVKVINAEFDATISKYKGGE